MPTRPPLDDEEFRRWRAEADRALSGARLQANAGLHNWACFGAEQAAQLATKALLHGLGRGPWGHDLVRLGELASNAGVEVPDAIADAFRRLGRHYISARYPDAHAMGEPGAHYGESDASEALNDAEGLLASSTGPGTRFVADAVAERRRERERLIGLARDYVTGLATRLPLTAAAVVGSVARGDFNVWSDVDVVVVANELPWRAPDRGALLARDAPPGVQAVGFTETEFLAAMAKANPLTCEATAEGIAITGEDFLRSAARASER